MSEAKFLRRAATFLAACTLTLNLFAASRAAGQEGAPPAPAASHAPPVIDVAQGKDLYDTNCSTCHGVDARGEDGPDLHGVPASLGDTAVENIIRRGIPGTGMTGFYNITDPQAANIVAYLRTLTADTTDTSPVSGDPHKGEAIYQSSGCSACHMIAGQGGSIGPELTRIGSMRGPASLKQRLLDPAANLPTAGGGGMMGNSWTEYAMYRAVEKDGHAIEGIRISEDSFTIVLKDATGKFHALWKPDLRSLERQPGKNIMPSFKDTLSAQQLDDLVAYLLTLKGAQ
ncbi:MAG TPA: c-type cytochrome [Candidatus Baltobacteraceae bacterium]|nr:c-type cytochrome [Candidatus Baltobacteraceae bacterium]HUA01350.1 c-type cytochrome [Candidatus Aquilonibacter sp.]